MKIHWEIFVIVSVLLLAIKLVEYYRFIKLQKQQLSHFEELIIELKNKQITLNQQLRIIKQSEKQQKDQFEIISKKIYDTIDNYFK
jgi:hypothetical protein